MRRVALSVAGAVLSLAFWAALAFGLQWLGQATREGSGVPAWLGGILGAGEMVLIVGMPVYAAAMRWWYRRVDREPGAPVLSWRHALEGAALSLGWWFLCVMILFGLFAGDPAPDTEPPPPEQVYRQEVVVAIVMVALYAVLSRWWRQRTLRAG